MPLHCRAAQWITRTKLVASKLDRHSLFVSAVIISDVLPIAPFMVFITAVNSHFLQNLANVKKVTVSLEQKKATVEVAAPSLLDAVNQLPQLLDSVRGLGFEAEPDIPVS